MVIKKSKVAISLIIIALIVLVGGYFLSKQAERIVITNDTIQSAINKKMPFTKNLPTGKVVISNATVRLNDTITVDLNGTLDVLDKKIPFTALTTGTVIYKSGKFYFKPSDINLNLAKVESTATPSVKSLLFDKLAKKAKDFGIDNKMAESEVKLILLNKLENIPVYSLKAGIVKASLENVSIEDNKLIISMSLIKLVTTVFLAIATVLISVITVIGLVFYGGSISIGSLMLI